MAKKGSHRIKHHKPMHKLHKSMYKESKNMEVSGVAFVGCIVVGVAFGMLLGWVAVGALFGVGIGFIVMAILRSVMKK